MKITTWSVMAGAALALVGCADRDFNTPDLLNHLRILAVQAEPPQPATGQSTTVRALVYQPPVGNTDGGLPEKVIKYRWSWCPFRTLPNAPSECPIKQETANELFAGVPGMPRLDLGEKETATFTNPFPASMLASLCKKEPDLSVLPALQQAAAQKGGISQSGSLDFGCTTAGFPITIRLFVDAEVAGKDVQFPAIFRIYLPVNDAIPPNNNPVIGAVNIFENDIRYPLDEAATWSGVRGAEVPMRLDLPLSSAELLPDRSLLGLAPDPNAPTREQLNVFWFTEGGRFGANHRGGDKTWYLGRDPNDPKAPFSEAGENTWKPYKLDKYQGATARLYVVAIDSRGGVGWTTGVARLVVSPENRDGGASDVPPDAGPPPDAATPDTEEDGGGEDSGGTEDAMAETLP